MISKNTIKFIKSLHTKKNRNESNLFIVEGAKSVSELIKSDFEIDSLYCTEQFLAECSIQEKTFYSKAAIISADILSQISFFETNIATLAVVKMKSNQEPLNDSSWILALDGIRDPGNLGTIIRTADWYGIRNIICSNDCTDIYNPKTIASSMGSFTRINLFYTDLPSYLLHSDKMKIGAFLNGESIYDFKFTTSGIIVIGNESNGISNEVEKTLTHAITIPGRPGAESLNASIATGIILDNWFRTSISDF